jgi:hypothetical protein
MGKAVADLPDVMTEDAAAVESLAKSGHEIPGVDDLLAQMAGEEIDRLLAEADATREAVPPEKPAEKIPQAIPDPPPAVLPEPPLASPPISPSSLDVVAAVVEALPTSPAAAVDLESATTTAERSALDEPVATAIAAAAATPAAPSMDAAVFESAASVEQSAAAAAVAADLPLDNDDSLPLYLKPLVWLNAPLSLLPQTVRELVGKVALLTLFNATAVLIYVVLFRKHH